MNRDLRTTQVQEAMKRHGVDAMILVPGSSMRYLTGFDEPGFERLLALVLTPSHAPSFVAPGLNARQIREQVGATMAVLEWGDEQGWGGTLSSALEGSGSAPRTIAVGAEMPARFLLPIRETYPQCRFSLAEELLAPLRSAKDEEEMAQMLAAARATDALLPFAYEHCRAGATEDGAAKAILSALADRGQEPSFDPIIAAGAHSAFPHHHPGPVAVSEGDAVIIDLGARAGGYCGDITRTVCIGDPSPELQEVYAVVYRAYCAGRNAVCPGATGETVDAAARAEISAAGYGDYFIHRTGHGIGLDDHEPPYIVAGNRQPLLPGQCFSIEPGVYLPGRFGVRLENIVCVDPSGFAQELNAPIPKEILCLHP